MANIPGSVSVSGFVAPTDTSDTYAATVEDYNKGGYRTVADVTARNAIPSARRKEGMMVRLADGSVTYVLKGGISNSNWTLSETDTLIRADVVLNRNGQPKEYFIAPTDTNSGRMEALRKALEKAALSPSIQYTVELIGGDFDVPVGIPLSTYVPNSNIKLYFSGDSALIYLQEADAGNDWRLFPTTERYGKWFGVRSGGQNMQPRIQAALFSMLYVGEPQETVPAYPGMIMRKGRLYLTTQGDIAISKTIYLTGFQQIYPDGGGLWRLYATDAMAPASGPDVPMIQVVRGGYNNPDVNPIGNFMYDVHVMEGFLYNTFTSNPKLTGLRYACGQGGKISLSIASMGQYSLDVMYNSGPFTIERLMMVDYLDHQSAPHLRIVAGASINFGLITAERLNFHTAASGLRKNWSNGTAYNGNLPAVYLEACTNLDIPQIYHEGVSTGTVLVGSPNNRIGGVECTRANGGPGTGDCLVTLINSDNVSVGNIAGAYFVDLLRVTRFAYTTNRSGGNSSFSQIPGFSTSRSFAYADVAELTMTRATTEPITPLLSNYVIRNAGEPTSSALYVFGGLGYPHIRIQDGSAPSSDDFGTASYNVILDQGANFGVFIRSKLNVGKGITIRSGASDPSSTDIPAGLCYMWYNSTSNELRYWGNISGVMKKSPVFT